MAAAAISNFSRPALSVTGQCLFDGEVLAETGVHDLSGFQLLPGNPEPELDFWMDWPAL